MRIRDRFEVDDFVRQRTAGSEIKLILSVDSRDENLPQMDRFTLQARDGNKISNIGAYELTRATEDEVIQVMREINGRR